MYARIYDANLAEPIPVEVETVEDLVYLFEQYTGVWHDWEGDGFVALLSEPSALLFHVDPDETYDPYPDLLVEWVTYPDGSEVRVENL